jgi:hypothetical protein
MQCGTTDSDSYYHWQIAISIFYLLSEWLLLVVFVWTLGTMLREQLGQLAAIFKFLYFAMIGILGALTCALIGLSSYNYWANTEAGYEHDAVTLGRAQIQVRLTYYVLYKISVLVAGGLAVMTIMSLRSKRHPAGVCVPIPSPT